MSAGSLAIASAKAIRLTVVLPWRGQNGIKPRSGNVMEIIEPVRLVLLLQGKK